MSTNGESKVKRVEGLVDGNGNPIASAPPADTELLDEISKDPDKVTQEKTTTIDPRRMPTDLLIYNMVRSTITEVSLGQQLQQVAFMKKAKKQIGDLPGEAEVRQLLQNAQAHRTILAHTLRDRFKDFDAAYCARIGVDLFTPDSIEVEDQTADNKS